MRFYGYGVLRLWGGVRLCVGGVRLCGFTVVGVTVVGELGHIGQIGNMG